MDRQNKLNRAQESFVLSVAGIPMKAFIQDGYFAEAFANRYKHFIAVTETDYSVDFMLGEIDCYASNVIPDTQFEGDCLSLCGLHMQGVFDASTGCGELILRRGHEMDSIEYYLRSIYALLTFKRGGLLFHSAGVIRNEYAYLFFGHSGCGKTTVARLSPGDAILNDDLVIILPEADSWSAHGTPFSSYGRGQLANSHAQVAGLFRLVQDEDVFLEGIGSGVAVAECFANLPVVAANPDYIDMLMERCRKIVTEIPIYRLHFRKEPTFWALVDKV